LTYIPFISLMPVVMPEFPVVIDVSVCILRYWRVKGDMV